MSDGEMTVNEQIDGWLIVYLQFYEVLGFNYEWKFPRGKGKKMTLTCGESEMKFEIDKTRESQIIFAKEALRDVTLMEQNRILSNE